MDKLYKELEETFKGQFMQPQVTGLLYWFAVDGSGGTCFYPSIYIAEGEARAAYQDVFGTVDTCEVIQGHGSRLSAPGYLDCTDWCVFDTESEACQYLLDTYGD